MLTDTGRLKLVMEQKIQAELSRLSLEADVCVFALYDAQTPDGDPIDFYCIDRNDTTAHRPPISLDFDGVGVWYFAFRNNDTFKVRKVLLQIEDHRFLDAQMGDFEGFWEDFPTYVAEDRWVQSITRRIKPSNDQPSPPTNDAHIFRPGHRASI